MLALPDIAIGAIAAAVIAGLVSLIGLIVSKEQKTSEFRQAWIDALRSEISTLISHANAIHGASLALSGPLRDAWKDTRTDFVGINEATAKIRLRLNPEEDPSRAILHTIEEIEEIFGRGGKIDQNELNKKEKLLVEQTNLVLKEEWIRVKGGELTYKVAKLLSIIIVLSFIIVLFIYTTLELLPDASSAIP